MPNRRARVLLAAAALAQMCAYCGPALAQDDCAALKGDEDTLRGELVSPGSWAQHKLLSKGDLDSALDELDYSGDELPLTLAVDLNHDGRKELFLTSASGRLCGNAGCPYVLLAGGTLRRIGRFFGHLALLDERVNGYRIVQTFSRLQADASNLDTYVFDGARYKLVAHAIVDFCGLRQWERRMRPVAK